MDICKRGRNAPVVRKAHCNSIQRIVLATYLPHVLLAPEVT